MLPSGHDVQSTRFIKDETWGSCPNYQDAFSHALLWPNSITEAIIASHYVAVDDGIYIARGMEIRLRNTQVGCVLQMRVSDKGSLAQTHDLESQAEEAKKPTIQSKN
ncbi:unnamed protein product [Fusarium venenatum]|uniref:Uncharacterized protein n=1 Tax=Fusarium venenatum TaxID=56646 RepID=A0A2L2TW21_9HYPO|nr:uncharacterized protein FVRRES_01177 [Fusarium venenatum]CEI64665.1 unnamed protein product [Fusarium venenatum]